MSLNFRPRGLSLLSVLIGTSVLMLLIGFCHRSLSRASFVLARESTKAELQQKAVLALGELSQDIRLSSSSGVSILAGGSKRLSTICAVQRMVAVTSDGSRVWEPKLVIYGWDQRAQELMRRDWPPSPPTLSLTITPSKPTRLTTPQMLTLAGSRIVTEETLVPHVQDFQISHQSGNSANIAPPFDLELVVSQQNKRGARFKLRRSCYPRNDR